MFKILIKQLALPVFILLALQVNAQSVLPRDVTIVRDSFGVPHIFGKTDEDASYGLAWAHSEDDFKSIQENLLPSRGKLGLVLGKEGVLFDFAMQFFGIDTMVPKRYEADLSPKFRAVLEAYIQGLNDYAAAHPDEVLMKEVLPFTALDAVKSFTLNVTLMSGAGMALKAIKENRIKDFYEPNEIGSNAMAVSPSLTEDGKAYLMVNSHQPLEGRFAWYEAHVRSEEGWDIIGGLFPGGVTIFVGSNKHLGWAHTHNYHTTGDIYQLQVKGGKYWYDGAWRKMETRKARIGIKLGGIKLHVGKKLYYSAQGPVFKAKHGWYAVRFPGYMDIRAAEQWYNMNKATSFVEFERAIKMEAIPMFNIVYSDVDGNIFWQSSGSVPVRPRPEQWKQPLSGTTSEVVWTELLPFNKKPSLYNPECGYVFNCNETPLNTSGEACNWNGHFTGCQRFQYNRGERFGELMKQIKGKFTWADLHRIKFDKSYCRDSSYAQRFKNVYNLDARKYPDIADAITKLKQWNFEGDIHNRDAALVLVMHEKLKEKFDWPFAMFMISRNAISEAHAVEAIRKAKRFLLDKHGTIDLPLGDIQKHIRGNVSYPASGLREVPRAADPKLYDKTHGLYRITGGDGYIQMNKYSCEKGAEVWSVNAYGASSKPNSPHYTDQMEMFTKEQFKRMTFDKTEIMKNATRIYTPNSPDTKQAVIKK